MNILGALLILLALAGCASPSNDGTDWGALSKVVGKQTQRTK